MNTFSTSPLLQPVTLGRLKLKNRIVMAPMTRSRADDTGVSAEERDDCCARLGSSLLDDGIITLLLGAGICSSAAARALREGRGFASTRWGS
ncbi:oxidoreductase [Paraburkholderia silvatlantica]|uniref:NADH:flavin oxidoreductase/NADH oxidase N-terminal domain-containing protein n=1 Tax=Paraburkholderia silvatlantica TaxID=321895 RepID=A0ABR6FPA4_9BURK|nr:hypothetical protein [Paraburkholderia silvatlantica]MBB2929251.1 hypothetical protein [Paraburkholderia silvatlantica]